MQKNILTITVAILVCFIFLALNFKSKILFNKEQAQVSRKNAVSSSNWDTNKVTVYTDPNGVVVPIPKGYVVSGVSTEKTVKTGLVIYEGTASVTSAPTSGSSVLSSAQATRNQWVWVPVNDTSRIYTESNGKKDGKIYSYSSSGRSVYTTDWEPAVLQTTDNEYYFARYSLHGMVRDKLYRELQVEFEETIKSIQKYGGFYIARYEIGNLAQKIPVTRKMNTDLVSQHWYEMYNKMTYLTSNMNIKSNMIWGCLWDETLQWLVDTGNKSYSQIGSNASAWGNYYDASFSYVTTTGSSSTKSVNQLIIVPSGSVERNKANNIYDLAGNVWEWTLENTPIYRVYRGGGFYETDANYPPSSRRGHYPHEPYGRYWI